MTKNLVKKYSKPDTLVKNKDRKLITEIQEQINWIVENVMESVSSSAPLNSPDVGALPNDLPVDVTVRTTKV